MTRRMIDLVFPAPVGRIQRSSGAATQSQHRDRVAVVRRLWKQERVDLLVAFREEQVGIVELLDADRRGALHGTLGDLILRRPLWPTIDAVLPRMGRGSSTRARYGRSFLRLQRLGIVDEDATVADLGGVPWNELLDDWDTSPSDWMHLRRAISHFLTVLLDDGQTKAVTIGRMTRRASTYHTGRLTIMAQIPTVTETEREPDLPLDSFLSIVSHFPEWLQPVPMTLAITGVRVGELLDMDEYAKKPLTPGLQVEGRTAKKKTRLVPVDPSLWHWIEAAVPSPRRYKALRLHWIEACRAAGIVPGIHGVTVHDIRHCRAQWALEAGADLAALQQILGHATITMTGRYGRRKLKAADARGFGKLMQSHLNKRKKA